MQRMNFMKMELESARNARIHAKCAGTMLLSVLSAKKSFM